jgi:hypothetical protein
LRRAFHEAGVKDGLLGVFYDPDLAAEAHRRGVSAQFEARLNRSETTRFLSPTPLLPRLSRQPTAIASAVAASILDCGWNSGLAPRSRSAGLPSS